MRAVVVFSHSLQAHLLLDLKVFSLGPFALATAGCLRQHISSSQLNNIPANLSMGRWRTSVTVSFLPPTLCLFSFKKTLFYFNCSLETRLLEFSLHRSVQLRNCSPILLRQKERMFSPHMLQMCKGANWGKQWQLKSIWSKINLYSSASPY